MHLQTFLSASALALSANALLLPPGAARPAKGQGNDMEFWDSAKNIMVAEPRKSIALPCPGCPVAQKDEKSAALAWTDTELDTQLLLDFTVEGNEIKLNGESFYPPSPKSLETLFHVTQEYTSSDSSSPAIYNGPIPIDTGVEVHPQMKIATVHMSALTHGKNPLVQTPMRRLTLDILGLASHVVRIDSVELWISQSDSALTLFGINTTPYTKHATPEANNCNTVMCRVRASIRQKLAAWRAAAALRLAAAKHSCMGRIQRFCGALRLPAPRPHGGMRAHHAHAKAKGGVAKFEGTLAPGGKNHPHGPHRHSHHGHRHGALRAVARFFRHVVLPIFIGVAAGMAVSGIGMLVGQAIVLLYLRARRGDNAPYEAVGQSEAEEGQLRRESFDELPKYEEAPAYEHAPEYKDEKGEESEEEQK